jgi:hypothetical protein
VHRVRKFVEVGSGRIGYAMTAAALSDVSNGRKCNPDPASGVRSRPIVPRQPTRRPTRARVGLLKNGKQIVTLALAICWPPLNPRLYATQSSCRLTICFYLRRQLP